MLGSITYFKPNSINKKVRPTCRPHEKWKLFYRPATAPSPSLHYQLTLFWKAGSTCCRKTGSMLHYDPHYIIISSIKNEKTPKVMLIFSKRRNFSTSHYRKKHKSRRSIIPSHYANICWGCWFFFFFFS